MQITLNETEIMAALETYVRSRISINDDQSLEIDMKAGRGENGPTATIDIVPANAEPAPVAEEKPQRQPKAKKAPVEEKADDETAADGADTDNSEAPAAEHKIKTIPDEPQDGPEEAGPKSTKKSLFSKAAG